MRILIAEDDEIRRKTLQRHLEGLGHDVHATTSGSEAWEIFQHEPYPLIISDWLMDGGDGLELCRAVRSQKVRDYTYFILLTIRSSKENYLEAMDSGVDDFLNKPLNKEDLSIRLRVAERILGYSRRVKRLKGLLPICMYCKRVRDDEDYWHQIDHYVQDHADADFTHGVCPECETTAMNLVDPGGERVGSNADTPRVVGEPSMSLCSHALVSDDVFEVFDAIADPRFADDPEVSGEPYIRFYAGCPLSGPDGSRIGTFSLQDNRPRRSADPDGGCMPDPPRMGSGSDPSPRCRLTR